MKASKEVIADFNEYVNMTASELENWLKSDDSNSAGWPKGSEGGESVGHDSGRRIVEILKSNPSKEPDKYTDEQVEHMRKVAAYCKRHLAQESAGNKDKSPEELKKTKSYASLKNWGHDFLKARGKEASGDGSDGKPNGSKKQTRKPDNKRDEEAQEDEKDNAEAENGNEDENVGDKRKNKGQQKGSIKKRQTRSVTASKKTKGDGEEDEDEDNQQEDDDDQEEEDDDGGDDRGDDSGKKTKKGPKKGDTVSWKWGSGNPQGKVLDVKEDKATITTKRGNKVSRDGNVEDPAVILDTGKSKAIKYNHELNSSE